MHSLQLQLQLPSCFSCCHYSSGDSSGLNPTLQPHLKQHSTLGIPAGTGLCCAHRLTLMIHPWESSAKAWHPPRLLSCLSWGSCSFPSRLEQHRSSEEPLAGRCTTGAASNAPPGFSATPRTPGRNFAPVHHGRSQNPSISPVLLRSAREFFN